MHVTWFVHSTVDGVVLVSGFSLVKWIVFLSFGFINMGTGYVVPEPYGDEAYKLLRLRLGCIYFFEGYTD